MKNLLSILIAAMLTSCMITNKHKTSHKKETKTEVSASVDSASAATIDSAGVRKTVIASTSETTGDYTTTTVIEFDTLKTPPGVNAEPLIKGSPDAEDYVTTIGKLRVKGRVKSITISEKGRTTEKTTTAQTAVDTAHKTATATTGLVKKITGKSETEIDDRDKTVSRKDWTGLVVGGVLLLILAAVAYYYRKRIGLFLSVLNLKIWPKSLPPKSSDS